MCPFGRRRSENADGHLLLLFVRGTLLRWVAEVNWAIASGIGEWRGWDVE